MSIRLRLTASIALAGAVVLSGAAAIPSISQAQPYYGDDGYYYSCPQQRSDNTAAGAVVGGAAGAAIGAGVGDSSTRCYDDRGYDYDRSGYYGSGYRSSGDDYDNNTAPDYYRDNGYYPPARDYHYNDPY